MSGLIACGRGGQTKSLARSVPLAGSPYVASAPDWLRVPRGSEGMAGGYANGQPALEGAMLGSGPLSGRVV